MPPLTERSMGSGQLPPGHRLGRYEVLARLASGGMAVVYVANAQGAAGFERLVAIKVLHANLAYEEEFIRMFLDEARLAARIRHPNVVSTIDISDTPEAGYYLVMEYVEGDHLGALLSTAHKLEERLPIPVVLRIVIDALGGLGAAHELRDDDGKRLNLVHRDVSPHNVMVGSDGTSRLTDFGVAKAEDRLTHTRDGQVKGKLAYMAPEQASLGTCDSRSDLFAMGIILWECVTGRRMFRAESTAATLNRLLHDEIAPPSAVDPVLAPLDPLLKRALARDPAARFQSAEEMIEALEALAPTVGGVAPRRAVAKAVERYAIEKLERDRRVVESARSALRSGQPLMDAAGEAAGGSEGTSPSRSAARARTGMTPAPGTVPRLFTHTRTPNVPAVSVPAGGRRNTLRNVPVPPEVAGPAPLPPPPPPVGAAYHAAGHASSPGRRTLEIHPAPARGGLFLVVLLCAAAVLAGGWLALRFMQPVAAPMAAPLPAAEPLAPSPEPAPAPAPIDVVPELPAAVTPAAPPVSVTAGTAAPSPRVAPTDVPKSGAATRNTTVRKPAAPAPVPRVRKPAPPVAPKEVLIPNPYTR
jgi:hypothetical protein